MSPEPPPSTENEAIEIRCYFVRERNALLVRGDFAPLFTDFYLHLMEHGIRYSREQDTLLKDGLAALTLHLASRPWNEAIAWTLSWQDPQQNVFITGSNRAGNIVGRLFTEDVRERDRNLFISQVSISGQEPRQSIIEAETLSFFPLAESYYRQSEQRSGRYFHQGDDEFVLITAQPDCDLEWLLSLDEEAIRNLDQQETLSLLETRHYRFDCGCGPERIYPIIAGMTEEAIASVFDGAEVISAGCPRCGARYAITAEALEAYRRDQTR
ncbi:MAG: Hsp33 family molecular chaperone HslO [Verrucomicrobiae bacterium]|nr:Hsp33 family molecular chaperone HslO [Verrucomicrobiae bacterium]